MDVHARISLDADPQSVGRARRFSSSVLRDWGADEDLVATCVLLVSELTTNAVLHAGTSFTVTIERREHLRVEVDDGDPEMPRARHYGPHAMSGRGLHLVEALARSSGATPAGHGKTVWFELDWAPQMVP